jgi:hypothetical protein
MKHYNFSDKNNNTYTVGYSENDGSSFENAIIIKAPNSSLGIHTEYVLLEEKFGKRDVDFKFLGQQLQSNNGKFYDVLEIKTSDGTTRKIYFDISDFFLKF